MRLRWTPAAAADLEEINRYLQQHHPSYRAPTILKLYKQIQSLKQFPSLGRPGCEAGTRELLFPPMPYIVVYRVRSDAIEILRIYHGARNLP